MAQWASGPFWFVEWIIIRLLGIEINPFPQCAQVARKTSQPPRKVKLRARNSEHRGWRSQQLIGNNAQPFRSNARAFRNWERAVGKIAQGVRNLARALRNNARSFRTSARAVRKSARSIVPLQICLALGVEIERATGQEYPMEHQPTGKSNGYPTPEEQSTTDPILRR
jgi:hypothetical protein